MSKRLLVGGSRQQELVTQKRIQTRIANYSSAGYSRDISNAYKLAADVFLKEGEATSVQIALLNHEHSLRESMRKNWLMATDAAGKRTLNQAKSIHGNKYTKFNDLEEEYADRITDYMDEVALRRAGSLARTTLQDVYGVIGAGLADGRGIDDIAGELVARAAVMSLARAMMIARTETHAAYNYGAEVSAEESELDLQKEWVSSADDRTRDGDFDHISANGEVVDLREYFVRTGEPLYYPGDVSGSAGNIINCRCGRVDVLV